MNTMLPPLTIFFFFNNFWVSNTGATVFIFNTVSKSARFTNCTGRVFTIPALFTTPSNLGRLSAKCSISLSSAISATKTQCPCPSIIDRVSLSLSSLRAVIITLAPILEHSTAVALPIPDDAPVTSTVFPSNEYGLYIIYNSINDGHIPSTFQLIHKSRNSRAIHIPVTARPGHRTWLFPQKEPLSAFFGFDYIEQIRYRTGITDIIAFYSDLIFLVHHSYYRQSRKRCPFFQITEIGFRLEFRRIRFIKLSCKIFYKLFP